MFVPEYTRKVNEKFDERRSASEKLTEINKQISEKKSQLEREISEIKVVSTEEEHKEKCFTIKTLREELPELFKKQVECREICDRLEKELKWLREDLCPDCGNKMESVKDGTVCPMCGHRKVFS